MSCHITSYTFGLMMFGILFHLPVSIVRNLRDWLVWWKDLNIFGPFGVRFSLHAQLIRRPSFQLSLVSSNNCIQFQDIKRRVWILWRNLAGAQWIYCSCYFRCQQTTSPKCNAYSNEEGSCWCLMFALAGYRNFIALQHLCFQCWRVHSCKAATIFMCKIVLIQILSCLFMIRLRYECEYSCDPAVLATAREWFQNLVGTLSSRDFLHGRNEDHFTTVLPEVETGKLPGKSRRCPVRISLMLYLFL